MPWPKAMIFFLACTNATTYAACTADSAATRPHLVELYSSEGCSSCPPAEAWLRTLRSGDDVVPLEFHVDYWDGLGWRDRFADARYTARQNEQARRDGSSSVFTPQLVLDGRNWSGWYRGGHLAPPQTAALSLHLATEVSGGRVRAEATSQALSAQPFTRFRIYAALLEDGLATDVRAGENRGVLLRHDHVVRAFAGPLSLARATIDLALPSDLEPERSTLVAFAQDPQSGEVAQVVALPLAQCRK